MKQFLVLGTIVDASKMSPELMKTHKAYTTKWMKKGKIVLSSLFSDYSGVANIVFADSLEEVKEFYDNEPFGKAGMQTYEIKEINIHYLSPNLTSK